MGRCGARFWHTWDGTPTRCTGPPGHAGSHRAFVFERRKDGKARKACLEWPRGKTAVEPNPCGAVFHDCDEAECVDLVCLLKKGHRGKHAWERKTTRRRASQ